MAFWKKSEDPWDQKPDKRREPREIKEPQANPLDSLKSWNEDRKAKEKEEAKRLPPEKCPWCGKDMEQGFLAAGRDPVRWYPGVYKFEFFRGLDGDAIDICNEGGFSGYYKTAWLCRECGKMIFDIPESERVYDFPESQDAGTEETQEEEESEK